MFHYEIEYIPGLNNRFADLLSRWGCGYRGIRKAAVCSVMIENTNQLLPNERNITWPDLKEISEIQKKARFTDIPVNISTGDWGVLYENSKIWIPPDASEMKLKLILIAHCGTRGHRGVEATTMILCESFIWKDMKADIQAFIDGCIHCMVSRNGAKIPRPLGSALHATRPNEVLHFDFLFMGPGKDKYKYVLILKDDFSSYVWLFPTEVASAETAAESICSWVAAFGAPDWFVSDQGTHFKNQLVQKITEELRIEHHFTTAYTPWANGTVERVCREVLRTCRALCSEWQLAPQDWPAVIETIQSILNCSPLPRLGVSRESDVSRSATEVFTGMKPRRPLLRAVPPSQYEKASSSDEMEIIHRTQIQSLSDAIYEMHREVSEKVTTDRIKRREAHNRKTNISSLNLIPGDFVLVRTNSETPHKLSFKWIGPRRVVSAKGPKTFIIENLLDGRTEVAHESRLILFRSNLCGTEVPEELLQAARHLESHYQTVYKLRSVGKKDNDTHIEVEWEGLPDPSDYTWEPALNIYQDVPEMFESFANELPDSNNLKRTLLNMIKS